MEEKHASSQSSPWQLTLTELGHLKTEFIWAHENILATSMKSKRYQAPGQSATLILKGSIRVETDYGTEVVREGNWCLPHHGPRVVSYEAGSHILTVRFRISWPSGEPLFNAPVATIFPMEAASEFLHQTRLLVQTVDNVIPGVKGELPWQKADLLTHFHFQRAFCHWVYEYVEIMHRIGDPEIARLIENCYPNTLDTTVRFSEFEGKPDDFAITGDILSTWLRDSTAHV